jgi:hypothetical protein
MLPKVTAGKEKCGHTGAKVLIPIEYVRQGHPIVNHFGLTWLLTPVFLRSGLTTHADTIPKLIVLWCAFELDAVL